MNLLLIEDDFRLAEITAQGLRNAGWNVDLAATLSAAWACMERSHPDLFIVDLGLPDGDGLPFIRSIRASGDNVPVLILTARTSVEERVDSLDAGADDYLTKPFRIEELLARCRSLARRHGLDRQVHLVCGNLSYSPEQLQFAVDGAPLGLTPCPTRILEILIENVGRVIPRNRLAEALADHAGQATENALDQELSRLRKKLLAAGATCRIETVRGLGVLLQATSQ